MPTDEEARQRRWTDPVAFFTVKADGRLGGYPVPKSEVDEARVIRRLNEIEIENGRMPWPNTEWAYEPGMMGTKRPF